MQPPERTGRATQKSRSALRRESGGAKGTVTWSARGQFHDPLCIHEGRRGRCGEKVKQPSGCVEPDAEHVRRIV